MHMHMHSTLSLNLSGHMPSYHNFWSLSGEQFPDIWSQNSVFTSMVEIPIFQYCERTALVIVALSGAYVMVPMSYVMVHSSWCICCVQAMAILRMYFLQVGFPD